MSSDHVSQRPIVSHQNGRRTRTFRAAIGLATFSLAGLAGCFLSSDGVPPPLYEFYYPTGLLVSPGATTLYVANSDFDLQYASGTLQSLDLSTLRDTTRTLRDGLSTGLEASAACKKIGVGTNPSSTLYPGPCAPVTLKPFVKKVAQIGAFASGIALAHKPCDEGRGARLFVPVRGDPSITYFDVDDDRPSVCGASNPATGSCKDNVICLDCGQTADGERCSDSFLIGRDPAQSQRALTLPVEPFGMAIDERGEAIVTAHQTTQQVSLVVNHWDRLPTLEHYLSDLSPGPTDIAALPIPRIVEENRETINYTPAFITTFRSAPEVDIIRYADDAGASPPRPFVTRALAASVAVTASSTDSRGVAIDGSARRACEELCPSATTEIERQTRNVCLRTCAETNPLEMFMANRAPAALVIGALETVFAEASGPNGTIVTGAYEKPSFYDSVPLAFGASRVVLGHVIDRDGHLARRVFAVTFDSRFVFSYDPEARRVDAVIRTGRGPHAIAFDTGTEVDEAGATKAYSTMYVGHFTDSYIGVVDLDTRNPTFGSMYMTLGQPVPPKESQ